MKNYLLPLVFATLFTSSVYADSEMKRKDIKTVEDVKEYRATVINKITERLNSGDLTEERANMLQKRIAKLESKPLPTQEQIDWKLANPGDISSMKQKRKIIQIPKYMSIQKMIQKSLKTSLLQAKR